MSLSVLAAASLGLLTPSAADQTPTPPSESDETLVCKYQARTATRFKKKICHTKAVWEEMSENAKRQAGQDFNKPTISIEKGN